MGSVVNAMPQRIHDPVAIVQEAGWARGPVWTVWVKYRPHMNSIPGLSSP